jgi:LuxR family transcriptional regulator, maltose regulon positive regulatory protein
MELPRILQTKIRPPSIQNRTLARPRVQSLLREALNYRLTLLQARAGYGKSTALAIASKEAQAVIWYQVSKEDGDPLVFLQYLCYATQIGLPGIQGLPLQLLESWDVNRGFLSLSSIVDQYLNVLTEYLELPCLLIIDDAHLILETGETVHLLDRLIALAPPHLHILISTRPKLQLPNLFYWRNRGEVLSLNQSVLAFTPAEITALFSDTYGYELSSDEAEILFESTEGWAIALQLIWQSLRTGTISSIEGAISAQDASLECLFDVLAQEVFSQQPQDVQDFLKLSSTLSVMTPASCDALLETSDSKAMLAFLRRQDLFVVDLGNDSLRYHHIFHQFLRQMVSPEQMQIFHARAAAFYTSQQDFESGIYHFLKAGDPAGAANLLETYGGELLAMGRLKTLGMYLDELPPETLRKYPALLCYMGDLVRLHSHFQEALSWYQQAESLWLERGQLDGVGRALRGQARLYLDTVNPHRAEELLQKALRFSDGTADRESQVRLYELLAENKLNAGKVEEADRLRQQAESLRREGPADSQLLIRVMLRTGRFNEALKELEPMAEAERADPVGIPRAHRETLFLLSLIHAFQGNAAQAYQTAIEGAQRALELASPFMTAVGHMRQGHALMLLEGQDRYARACVQFEKAIEISQTLAVPRLRVEACWGLSRAFGYQGDLGRASQIAEQGLNIATQAGDEWVASLIRLSMGASFCLAARFESAGRWLTQAVRGFEECSDPFGLTAAQLWLCLGWFLHGELDRLEQTFPKVLASCRGNGYEFLFTRPTLLGTPNERLLVPLLIHGRENGWESAYISDLLDSMGLSKITLHPGYQLRVTTLGSFQTLLGDDASPVKNWRREKTRHLFQLLVTFRSDPLEREQIFEHLWPDCDPVTAQRYFKVALNALLNVLEPARRPGSDSAYILREGSAYRIRPEADLWLDADQFVASVQTAEELPAAKNSTIIHHLEKAVGLYQGEYLPDTRYENWVAAEREHLAVLFLRAADRLCDLYLQGDKPEESIDLCYRILVQDNCWERAYRHLMLAYDRLGDNGQIARIYQRCRQTLREELEVSPSAETEALFGRLTLRGKGDEE